MAVTAARVAQQCAPVLHRSVGSEQSTGALERRITDLQQFFGDGDVGNLRMPRSSMIRNGTEASSSICSLRVPSIVASARSSSSLCVSRYSTRYPLLNGRLSDGLGEMTFSGAGWA